MVAVLPHNSDSLVACPWVNHYEAALIPKWHCMSFKSNGKSIERHKSDWKSEFGPVTGIMGQTLQLPQIEDHVLDHKR